MPGQSNPDGETVGLTKSLRRINADPIQGHQANSCRSLDARLRTNAVTVTFGLDLILITLDGDTTRIPRRLINSKEGNLALVLTGVTTTITSRPASWLTVPPWLSCDTNKDA